MASSLVSSAHETFVKKNRWFFGGYRRMSPILNPSNFVLDENGFPAATLGVNKTHATVQKGAPFFLRLLTHLRSSIPHSPEKLF